MSGSAPLHPPTIPPLPPNPPGPHRDPLWTRFGRGFLSTSRPTLSTTPAPAILSEKPRPPRIFLLPSAFICVSTSPRNYQTNPHPRLKSTSVDVTNVTQCDAPHSALKPPHPSQPPP